MPDLLTHMGKVLVVTDHIIGGLALAVKRKLLAVAFFEFVSVPVAGGTDPIQAEVIGRIDEDEAVAILIQLAFQEQGAVLHDRDDGRIFLMLLTLHLPALMDQWVDDRFELIQCGGVGEDDAAQRGTGDVALGIKHIIAPLLPDLLFDRVGLQGLVREAVSIDHSAPKLREGLSDRGLA